MKFLTKITTLSLIMYYIFNSGFLVNAMKYGELPPISFNNDFKIPIKKIDFKQCTKPKNNNVIKRSVKLKVDSLEKIYTSKSIRKLNYDDLPLIYGLKSKSFRENESGKVISKRKNKKLNTNFVEPKEEIKKVDNMSLENLNNYKKLKYLYYGMIFYYNYKSNNKNLLYYKKVGKKIEFRAFEGTIDNATKENLPNVPTGFYRKNFIKNTADKLNKLDKVNINTRNIKSLEKNVIQINGKNFTLFQLGCFLEENLPKVENMEKICNIKQYILKSVEMSKLLDLLK